MLKFGRQRLLLALATLASMFALAATQPVAASSANLAELNSSYAVLAINDSNKGQASSKGIQLRGALRSGGLIIGKTQPTSQVWLNQQALSVSNSGHVVFGFGRDTNGSQTLTVQHANGEQHVLELQISARDYAIDRVDGVPQRTVTPNPEQQQRTRKEAEKVWLARTVSSTREDYLQPLIMPAQGRISGVYGSQRIFNGTPRNPHYGLDIAAPTGTPVQAPWPGKVVLAEPDLFYSGGTLIIDHGFGITTTYIHLNQLHVKVGDNIEQGQHIADIGATGRVTGPHLDWRINWGHERLDPALALEHFQAE